MCSSVMILKFPVADVKMSISPTTDSMVTTWKPSLQACRAQIGSISVTSTRAPAPRMAKAQPLPTSPYPQTSARFPPIITSVARMMPSGCEWRHPYTLSNLLLVTQSFTLMAGKSSSPFAAISLSLCTPVVVSSLTPLHFAAMRVYLVLSAGMESRSNCKMHLNSALSVLFGSGRVPSLANFSSYSLPLWMSSVASPPSSTSWSQPSAPGTVIICSVHHQYSGNVSPFHAKTVEVPALAMAAAAWSCVLKMLHEHQRTFAPSAAKVSISTPVWMVMCKEPLMFKPLKGWAGPYSVRAAIKPGISCSANVSSLRPNSAKPMSFTLESAMVPGTSGGGTDTHERGPGTLHARARA